MGILSWIVFGLIVGALARWLLPGRHPGGLVKTMLLGIGGALLGGYMGSRLEFGTTNGFTLEGLAVATVGAVLVLVIYRVLLKLSR